MLQESVKEKEKHEKKTRQDKGPPLDPRRRNDTSGSSTPPSMAAKSEGVSSSPPREGPGVRSAQTTRSEEGVDTGRLVESPRRQPRRSESIANKAKAYERTTRTPGAPPAVAARSEQSQKGPAPRGSWMLSQDGIPKRPRKGGTSRPHATEKGALSAGASSSRGDAPMHGLLGTPYLMDAGIDGPRSSTQTTTTPFKSIEMNGHDNQTQISTTASPTYTTMIRQPQKDTRMLPLTDLLFANGARSALYRTLGCIR